MAPEQILFVQGDSAREGETLARLQALGYSVTCAFTSDRNLLEEAIASLPALAVLEIGSAIEMQGIERAAETCRTAGVPVILLWQGLDDQSVERVRRITSVAVMEDSVDDDLLRAVVEQALCKQRLEQEISDSRSWFAAAVRAVNGALIAVDADGRVSLLNGAAESLTGWSSHAAVGLKLEEVFQIEPRPADAESGSLPRSSLTTGNAEVSLEPSLLIKRDGGRVPIDMQTHFVNDQWGMSLGRVVVFHDATERAAVARDLRPQGKECSAIMNALQAGIVQVDSQERIVMGNAELLHILDEDSLVAVIGRSLFEYVVPEQHQLIRTQTEVRRSGISSQYEIVLISARQQRKEVLVSVSPTLGRQGEYTGAVSVLVDITRWKSAENQLLSYYGKLDDLIGQRTLQLEQANEALRSEILERERSEQERRKLEERLHRAEKLEALGMLAGGVAHDLNNTLGPLVGYPELILKKLPQDSPVRKLVVRIGNAAEDAAQIIQDLLTLARRGRYEMRPTSLNRVLEEYFDSPGFLKLAADHPGITVSKRLDPALPNILGSAAHLSKVIMNLVVNAYDAMKGQGTLAVTTARTMLMRDRTECAPSGGPEGVSLTVRDTGCGIPPEDLDKIFEPYYSKKQMGRSGTGLGLSIVYGIVKDHCGHFDITSTVGQGTEFQFYFPATLEDVTDRVDATDSRGQGESVLVVDDQAQQRELAVEMLTGLGYRAQAVGSGREAVDLLRKQTVDLVILDMVLEGGMDGLDTYREILGIRPDQKALAFSGYSQTERVSSLLELGAAEYLKKPFSVSALGHAVRSALDRPHQPSEHAAMLSNETLQSAR